MEKIKIANELLKNTNREYLKVFISKYILNFENGEISGEEFIRFDNCITYIEKENFDITGWQLFEIPIFYAHCFKNIKTNQLFDLAVWDIGVTTPRYLDDKCNEQDAKSIQEAIDNYFIQK